MSQQICYDVVIRLEEDLHSGTGTGTGSLDAIQITGRDGLPVIRATHIKGLLREAGRFLCEMELYSDTEYKDLFGEEGGWQRSALLMQSLRYTENQEENWSQQWTSTSREINSRTSKENTLRTLQYVKAGSSFKGQWILTQPELRKFLQDCLQQVTHLGSNRSRGGGRIFVEVFEQTKIAGNRQNLSDEEVQTCLRLVLKNLEPLCLPITGFPGNIIPSECYIRGQQLLGALVAYSVRYGNKSIAEKLLNGKISIGNAYPVPENISNNCDQWTVLAFPLNIYHKKPEPITSTEQPWWTEQTSKINSLGERGEQNKFLQEASDGEKLKRPGDREFLFRSNESDNWQRYQPKMAIHMRNQTPGFSLVKENRQDDLFSEEEILEDTSFMTEIVFSNLDDAKDFAEEFTSLLNGQTWLSLGRGGRPVKVQNALWLEPEKHNSNPKTDKLTIVLTSDLIVRTDTLGFYDSLDVEVLEKILGIKINNLESKVYKDTVTVRGFNYLTRLPKVPVLAIRRGSALELRGKEEDIGNLRQALQQKTALGERTHEGFGRFKLNLAIEWENNSPQQIDPEFNSRIGTQETILKAAKKLADDLSKNDLSKTQWQYLGQQALIKNIDDLFDELEEHSKKTAGAAWKEPIKQIKNSLNNKWSHENQVLFLDTLVRYQFARLKMAESKKHDN